MGDIIIFSHYLNYIQFLSDPSDNIHDIISRKKQKKKGIYILVFCFLFLKAFSPGAYVVPVNMNVNFWQHA